MNTVESRQLDVEILDIRIIHHNDRATTYSRILKRLVFHQISDPETLDKGTMNTMQVESINTVHRSVSDWFLRSVEATHLAVAKSLRQPDPDTTLLGVGVFLGPEFLLGLLLIAIIGQVCASSDLWQPLSANSFLMAA
ncbi:hypothetical protein Tco_1123330 [Tanacetum coccineum]|uniref:Uncharacterized protein n=1 Tax=Tanacetum coccineum TaxID=301880 RepID=A0ABQ5J314_9ASTR